ncbi:polysaccharide biosynthesis tyrosine autokinase [Herbiconiux sp. KACC 21604]|uniref:polysaccharide biosynthesis tyrosine autokinase n=1 Tax=unclassified Herbiconiux TaxID=2618217 RepID=UPI0014929A3A|nr:polysaccharide biosynthesis tyrosine autokinase [Herbiconiux sp. SALV-R1]QJU54590.1 polysaccharide biosynthesis tyrosine autokinase [Herbiconiux sp. SALV-R1]WPO85676.1 polysaccharide biosynthesis tyrosine autokinase [Herbiconiux sp. KACC 21604]
MELRSYLPVLRAHWLAIVLITLLGGAVAFGWTLLQPKIYSADSSGYVTAGSNSDTGNALVGDNLAQSKVKSYIDIGTSRAVAQSAIDELGLTGVTPEGLVNRITVTNPAETVLIKVTATGPSPTDARDLAEAWLRGMATQISAIEGGSDAGTESIVQLVALDSAVLPTSPTSPNTRLAIGIGLLAGLVLGLVYAFIRHALDRRIRTVEAVEREFEVSVVGSIPVDKRFTDEDRLVAMDGATDYSRDDDDDVAVAESLRELRTNLQYMNVDNPPRVIVVTSPLPGDGKSTTIANLAIALAAGGQAVVLVDADLRRPTVSKTFNLVGGAGLTEVLAGRSDVADVLQPWGTSGKLLILAAGKTPPNPSELLGSERMHTLLQELSEHAVVLIDAPPLIPVTDAAILTHNTDGALVVASIGKTTFEALSKALQNLERANGQALGIILNRVPRRGVGSNYGYYGYKGDYRSRPDSEPDHADHLSGASPSADIEPAVTPPHSSQTNPIAAASIDAAANPLLVTLPPLPHPADGGTAADGSSASTFDDILAGAGIDQISGSETVDTDASQEEKPRPAATRRELRSRARGL